MNTVELKTRLLRAWPLLRGRWRAARALGIGYSDIPDGEWMRAGPLDLEVRVHPDPVYFDIYYFRTYEAFETDVLLSAIGAGDVVIDVGANFGWFSLHASRQVGATGRVMSFEPQAALVEELRLNASRNNLLAPLQLCTQAVSDHPGVITLVENAQSHAYATTASAGSSGRTVNAVTLDSLDVSPSALKCDVEGGELAVIRGARNVLSKHHPLCIFEINRQAAAKLGWNPEDMIVELSSLGYTDFFFCSHAVRARRVDPTRRLPSNGNLIATTSERPLRL